MRKIPARASSTGKDRYFRFVCPPELRTRMGKHPEVNWSAICRGAVEETLASFDRLDRTLKSAPKVRIG